MNPLALEAPMKGLLLFQTLICMLGLTAAVYGINNYSHATFEIFLSFLGFLGALIAAKKLAELTIKSVRGFEGFKNGYNLLRADFLSQPVRHGLFSALGLGGAIAVSMQGGFFAIFAIFCFCYFYQLLQKH